MFDKRECCGTCAWHIPMPLDEWCCDNEDADNYGDETDYEFHCNNYERRN